VIPGLPTGTHDVQLSGVAQNCTLSGQNPRSVTVIAGNTVDVAFAVACVATGVWVTTATTGLDLDLDGYAVAVDGGSPQVIGVNASLAVTRLGAGTHMLALSGAAANCAVAGTDPRSVSIVTGETAPVTFTVTCGATTGAIQVTAATSGLDPDVNGYTVRMDGGASQAISTNGTVHFNGVTGGSHQVELQVATVSLNCTISGENPRTLSVTTGGVTRDTARTTFAVSCVSNVGTIRIAAVTSGAELDPDGYRVLVDEWCYDYYGYQYCYSSWTGSVAPNGVGTTASLGVGSHTVKLTGVARNCTLAGDNPRTVTVLPGDATTETFTVTCVQTGAVQVTVATTGTDVDPDGYMVCVDYVSDWNNGYFCNYHYAIGANGAAEIAELYPGSHTVLLEGVAPNCTVAGPNPRSVNLPGGTVVEVAFQVNCVTAVVLVPYGATGYRFKVLPNSSTPGGGFESPSFDDVAAGFSTGTAPFGAAWEGADCPLDPTVQTNWSPDTDILLRKTFVVPAGATNVKVVVAIDNDVQVFVNGVDITASAGPAALADGFQRHGGCAELDSFVFTVPNEILLSGSNLVAIRARDRGGISYADVQVIALAP
jgi:hypothetical protein